MKKILQLASVALLANIQTSFAQTWDQLPYYYPRTTQSKPVIFSSPNNVLVAGLSFNSGPASHISLDGGTTWQQIFADKPITSVEFGPDGTIYFIASKRYLTTSNYYMDTLFTSTDGISWTNMGYKLTGGNGSYGKNNFVISDNNTLLFPNFQDASGVYLSKSTDNGVSWTPTAVKSGPVSCSPTADTIVTSFDSPWPGGARYSHDGGATVTDATGLSAGGTITVRTPNGDIYAAAIGAIYKSTDGGMTYGSNLLTGPIGNIQDFVYAPNGKFYIRVSGGVIGIWETSDFVSMTGITATMPDYNLLSDMHISNNYLYAVTDTNLYRYSLGTTSVPATPEAKSSVSVYPNPATDLLHVAIGGNTVIDHMELVNVYGAVAGRSGYGESAMDVRLAPPGMYYLKITAGKNVYMEKVIIGK